MMASFSCNFCGAVFSGYGSLCDHVCSAGSTRVKVTSPPITPVDITNFVATATNPLANESHKYALGQVCEHGKLARSCDVCDLTRELTHVRDRLAACEKELAATSDRLAECEESLAKAIASLASANRYGDALEKEIAKAETALAAMTADRDTALADARVLREALQSIIENDKTRYDHHEARPDGKLPRSDGGTCWLTPKELATAALTRNAQ